MSRRCCLLQSFSTLGSCGPCHGPVRLVCCVHLGKLFFKNIFICFSSVQTHVFLCDKTFPGKTQHIRLLTQDMDPLTDQSTKANKIQHCEPVSLQEYG